MTSERLGELIRDIGELPTLEATQERAIQISMADLGPKTKGFLNKAIDLRLEAGFSSPLVEDGEYDGERL